eukprot:7346424-Heterocapsa_arctica.AAC.1
MSRSSGSIDILFKSRTTYDNPDEDVVPSSIPAAGDAIPGSDLIPDLPPGDSHDCFIPSEAMDIPASGSADRPHYSEHPA